MKRVLGLLAMLLASGMLVACVIVDFSDHASYWRFDMPAIMITDTAFMRNPNYHQAGDTADTLDYDRMAQVVRGVHAVAREF